MVLNVTEITVSYRWKILEKEEVSTIEEKRRLRRWAPAWDGLESLKIPEIFLQELILHDSSWMNRWIMICCNVEIVLLSPKFQMLLGGRSMLCSQHDIVGFMGTGQPRAPPEVCFIRCGSQASNQEVSLTRLHDLPDSISSPSLGSIYILAKH